jgi:nucleoid DNA-binding protein
MDIELLSKMIGELVRDRSEVGLPGLGSFVSEFVPASFSDRGYTINPPYKRVTFVPGQAEDDSLVKLYAQSNNIDEDQSRAILLHFLEETKKVLMDKKTVVFPGLGRLRATRQNNFFFITDESLDIYPEGFGLSPISLKNQEEAVVELHHVVESLADILVEPVEPAPETASASEPTSAEPESEAVPASEPAPEEVPASESAPEAASASEPAPVEPATEVSPETQPAEQEVSEQETKPRRRVSKWVWLTPLLLIGLAALALAVFMILAQAAPDFLDTILYTPEELRIINY